jgi:hypothetical protein
MLDVGQRRSRPRQRSLRRGWLKPGDSFRADRLLAGSGRCEFLPLRIVTISSETDHTPVASHTPIASTAVVVALDGIVIEIDGDEFSCIRRRWSHFRRPPLLILLILPTTRTKSVGISATKKSEKRKVYEYLTVGDQRSVIV